MTTSDTLKRFTRLELLDMHAAATILHIDSTGVTINCPHCGGEHHHGRAVLGSHHVVAGCHTGFRICREYAIPNPGGKR